MAKTIYFESCEAFMSREDRHINGTNNPDHASDEDRGNVGCWNCTDCNDCNGCNGCYDCNDCNDCNYLYRSYGRETITQSPTAARLSRTI